MILRVITLHVLPMLTGAQAHCQAACLGLFGYLLTLLFFLFQCSPNTLPLSHLIGGFALFTVNCEVNKFITGGGGTGTVHQGPAQEGLAQGRSG